MFVNYAKDYDLFNQDKNYKEEVKFVYKWAEKPKSILDIGCGTASYWKYFPKTVKLTGVEKSKQMISQSKYHDRIACYDVTEAIPCAWESVDCAIALFDVLNYIPKHNWWAKLPIKKGGFFIFDIWNSDKANCEGFKKTVRAICDKVRVIEPVGRDGNRIDLKIDVDGDTEVHPMYLYDKRMIEKFCGDEFEIVEVKETETWQQWWKLKRK